MKITRQIRLLLEQCRGYWVLHRWLYFRALDRQCRRQVNRTDSRPNLYFFLSADYGNLGDYAITLAQRRFLQEAYPDYRLTEVTMEHTAQAHVYAKEIRENDMVAIVGGGNMGNLYYQYELNRQYVLGQFSRSNAICFPQSLFLTNDRKGELVSQLMADFYASIRDRVVLLFREQQSYASAQQLFPQNALALVPDIVFTLDEIKSCERRQQVLFCIRDDAEASMSGVQIARLHQQVEEHGYHVNAVDTHIGAGVFEESYLHDQLENLLEQFRSAAFVVTDRLHGMIFAYITGTPAIVLPNNNGKIENSYRWIADCPYVRFCKDLSELDVAKWIAELSDRKVDYSEFSQRRIHFINQIKDACSINRSTGL